jgi:hypothetical protein
MNTALGIVVWTARAPCRPSSRRTAKDGGEGAVDEEGNDGEDEVGCRGTKVEEEVVIG